ncbi:MAG: HPr(Ser) kinase/phosphatase [Gammaproteobacteria bacterium]|nr:MAG: HPr(Ser) kinase/phosphatase [Gammaproteobacteria bacterium]
MAQQMTAAELFEELERRLACTWLAGSRGRDRPLRPPHLSDNTALLGHLNLIHPNQVQVLGSTEVRYLQGLRKNSREDALERLFHSGTQVILMAEGLEPPEDFVERAEVEGLPIWQTAVSSYDAIAMLRHVFTNRLAEKTVVHGVFLEVLGIGLLITGESRVGKSELALELITRGHRLVADDSPQFARIAPDILNGTAPPILQDLLEVRGLGVLNIRAMYGDNAIKMNKYLRLVIHLADFDAQYARNEDRLQGNLSVREILGIAVPQITLPVAPGRNLAVLVEAAVRNHLLRSSGYNAADDLIARQERQIAEQTPDT